MIPNTPFCTVFGDSSRTLHFKSPDHRFALYIAILLALLAKPAFAWRVESFSRVPAGTSALTTVNGALWSGYTNADTLIRVLSNQDGSTIATYPAPEAICHGLAYRAGSLWFLGRDHLFELNLQGQILSSLNLPYAHMRGLASGDSGLWTVELDNGAATLVQFKTQGGEAGRHSIDVSEPGCLFWDGAGFWLTEPTGGFIHRYDQNGQAVDIYPTPAYYPSGITVLDGALYLIDAGDEEAGDVLYQISVQDNPAPRILASGRFHDFGLAAIHSDLTWNLGLFNVGGVDLVVSNLRLLHPGNGFSFGQVNLPITVSAGQVGVVTITFEPGNYGNFADTLIVESNDSTESLVPVMLFGTGVYVDRMLIVTPDPISFGQVRSEPARDGSRHLDINLINVGATELTVTSARNNVPEIFHLEPPDLPLRILPADTLTCRIWFTPHRSLQYLDTLTFESNGLAAITQTLLIGTGVDSNYTDGTILWSCSLGNSGDSSGAVAIGADLNGDGIREVIAAGPDGHVVCLNGFASGAADAVWEQDFAEFPQPPVGIRSHGALEANVQLNGDGIGDVVFGTDERDGAVYALDGVTGGLLWKWSVRDGDVGLGVYGIIAEDDFEGDGATDPVALVIDRSHSFIVVRLDGHTGRPVWARSVGDAIHFVRSPDLNGDGCGDYIAADDSSILVVSGADGSLLHRQRVASISSLLPVGQIPGVAGSLAMVGTHDGVKAVDLISGQTRWTVNNLPDNTALGEVNLLALYRGEGLPLLAAADAAGHIVIFDSLSNGHIDRSISAGQSHVTSLSWAAPDRVFDLPSLAVGFEDGGATGFMNGDRIWSFDGGALRSGSILSVLSFDDVDFGGSKDVLALTADEIVRCISTAGDVPVSVKGNLPPVPSSPMLVHVYPNPFNSSTRLAIDLPMASPLTLEAYDVLGRLLERRVLGVQPAGRTVLDFRRADSGLSGGVLLFRVRSNTGEVNMRGVYIK